ncbi:hypothetical protein J3R30DRAFT_3406041 [Lentinula aciculospora]|uniref:Uncharacterized protein n=1 Tax=Lentinula aciculospora TaxID=153920 RepID=A0A9W9A6U0_9AGAR|nr:hypothetical protein J3R30DRAFT_3406041 [Lentinula aciculospora]
MRFKVVWICVAPYYLLSAVYAAPTLPDLSNTKYFYVLYQDGLTEFRKNDISKLIKDMQDNLAGSSADPKLQFIPISENVDTLKAEDGTTAFYINSNHGDCQPGCKGLVDQSGKGQIALVRSGNSVFTSEGSNLRVFPIAMQEQTWFANTVSRILHGFRH